MRWKPKGGDVDWLHAAFSGRAGGVSVGFGGSTMNLGWSAADDPMHVVENRRRLMREAWADDGGARPELVTAVQVHSAETVIVRAGESHVDAAGRTTLRGDGLMTGVPGLLLGIQTADCVPVLVADTRLRVVAGFHAGWRGTVGRIVEQGVARMGQEYGSRAEDLVAAVGPAIGMCCYAVGEEVRERFAAEFGDAAEVFAMREEAPRWEQEEGGAEAGARMYLDLHEANRRQLLAAGVPGEKVEVMRAECTACAREADGTRRYFSYRAERGSTGRMMAVIGIAGGTS